MDIRRQQLLDRILTDVAANGLGDRSLRELATAVGSSHRMLLYHFGSRAGLIAAIVESMEATQRQLFAQAAASAPTSSYADLIRTTWANVTDPAAQPYVRLFFELVGQPTSGSMDLTGAWLEDARAVIEARGETFDADGVRLGVAVTRGLLIDVLTGTPLEDATASLEQFIALAVPDARDNPD